MIVASIQHDKRGACRRFQGGEQSRDKFHQILGRSKCGQALQSTGRAYVNEGRVSRNVMSVIKSLTANQKQGFQWLIQFDTDTTLCETGPIFERRIFNIRTHCQMYFEIQLHTRGCRTGKINCLISDSTYPRYRQTMVSWILRFVLFNFLYSLPLFND